MDNGICDNSDTTDDTIHLGENNRNLLRHHRNETNDGLHEQLDYDISFDKIKYRLTKLYIRRTET